MALECVFLVARCNIYRTSWEPRRKDWVTEKKYIEEFKWETSSVCPSNVYGPENHQAKGIYYILQTGFWRVLSNHSFDKPDQ